MSLALVVVTIHLLCIRCAVFAPCACSCCRQLLHLHLLLVLLLQTQTGDCCDDTNGMHERIVMLLHVGSKISAVYHRVIVKDA